MPEQSVLCTFNSLHLCMIWSPSFIHVEWDWQHNGIMMASCALKAGSTNADYRYLVALLLTFQLPLPSFRERALHDIDEGKAGRDAQRRKRLHCCIVTHSLIRKLLCIRVLSLMIAIENDMMSHS